MAAVLSSSKGFTYRRVSVFAAGVIPSVVVVNGGYGCISNLVCKMWVLKFMHLSVRISINSNKCKKN